MDNTSTSARLVAGGRRSFRVRNAARSAPLVVVAMAVATVGSGIAAADAVVVSNPFVSVGADVVVGEGDGFVDLAVSLSAPSESTVTVDYTTGSGSATANDVSPRAGTLTFQPGVTMQTVRVDIYNDPTQEGQESFYLTIDAPTGATIDRQTQTITIVDNDTVIDSPALSVLDAVVDETAGTVVLPVVLGWPAGTATGPPVTVQYTTNDVTAESGSDYAAGGGTLTFGPGEVVRHVTLPITNDSETEPAESFSVTLASPLNATILQEVGVVTIAAADAVVVSNPFVSVGADVVVGEGDGFVDLAVSLSAPSESTVSVDYTTGSGSATANDVSPRAGTLTFQPGVTMQTVRVDIYNDPTEEGQESFYLTIDAPTGATIDRQTQTITIVDNDTVIDSPALSVLDAVVDETAGTVVLPVVLGWPAGTATGPPVTVQYTTNDVTAESGSDYAAGGGTLTFGPGEVVRHVTLPITNDSETEPAESFSVTLASPLNATILQEVGVVTIAAADAVVVSNPFVSVGADVVVGEGDGFVDLAVSLSAPSESTVTVDYTTGSGSATANDVSPRAGTLTFQPGVTMQTVRVDIYNDPTEEGQESFYLTINAPTGATIDRQTQTITIVE